MSKTPPLMDKIAHQLTRDRPVYQSHDFVFVVSRSGLGAGLAGVMVNGYVRGRSISKRLKYGEDLKVQRLSEFCSARHAV